MIDVGDNVVDAERNGNGVFRPILAIVPNDNNDAFS